MNVILLQHTYKGKQSTQRKERKKKERKEKKKNKIYISKVTEQRQILHFSTTGNLLINP